MSIRVLFVCHGNICRSVMAEYIMKDLAKKRGMADAFEIASAATSTEEIGNDIYPPAKRTLIRHNISFDRHEARQIEYGDYAYYDFLIGMDEYNIKNMEKCFGGDPYHKISMLLKRAIEDPWYTGNFEKAYADLDEGVRELLDRLMDKYL